MNVQAKQIPEVTIKLSEYEALVLQSVLGCVGGSSNVAWKVVDVLHEKLAELPLNRSVFSEVPEGVICFR